MRMIAAGSLLVLAACVTERVPEEKAPLTEDQQRQREDARASFEAWKGALSDGDAEVGFVMMTDAYKSEWLYGLLQGNTEEALEWKRSLKGRSRDELDLWFYFCKKHQDRLPRIEPLPPSVLSQPSLLDLWKRVFAEQKTVVKVQMSGARVDDVAWDPAGVIVRVLNLRDRPELYSMIFERGMWKVDGHIAR